MTTVAELRSKGVTKVDLLDQSPDDIILDIRERAGEYRFTVPGSGLEPHDGGMWHVVHTLYWEPMLAGYRSQLVQERTGSSRAEAVAKLVERDPHDFGNRPCTTCTEITRLLGRKFGCYTKQ